MTARDPRPFDLALIERYEAHDWPDEAQGKQIMRLCWLARRGLDAAPAPAAEPCPHGDDCPDARKYGNVHPAPAEESRPCTCHPDDNPPRPCPQKYALSECRAAAEPPQDVAKIIARLNADADAWMFHGGQHVQSCRITAELEREAAAALAAMAKERDELATKYDGAHPFIELHAREEERREQAERERDEARALLLRWLQAHNKMDGRSGLSVAEFDKLRQDTHAARAK